MEKKRFEELLDTMGIVYTHTASRATQQSRQSLGRYTMTGDWIEEETILNSEPDGVKIEEIACSPSVCDYCDLIVDKPAVLNIQYKINRFKSTDWKVKCKTCRKELDFMDFKQSIKSDDK